LLVRVKYFICFVIFDKGHVDLQSLGLDFRRLLIVFNGTSSVVKFFVLVRSNTVSRTWFCH